jgi:hypothetical protein
MTDKTVADLIGSVLEKQPDEFKSTFNDIMISKVADALEVKRQEVSQNYFDTGEEDGVENETITTDTEEENGQDA